MISPNDLRQDAIDMMLDGREPEFEVDQMMLMNFYALNVAPTLALPICKLMNGLYEMGLPDHEIEHIVRFQLTQKGINPN